MGNVGQSTQTETTERNTADALTIVTTSNTELITDKKLDTVVSAIRDAECTLVDYDFKRCALWNETTQENILTFGKGMIVAKFQSELVVYHRYAIDQRNRFEKLSASAFSDMIFAHSCVTAGKAYSFRRQVCR